MSHLLSGKGILQAVEGGTDGPSMTEVVEREGESSRFVEVFGGGFSQSAVFSVELDGWDGDGLELELSEPFGVIGPDAAEAGFGVVADVAHRIAVAQ